jgi:hypothetical protein
MVALVVLGVVYCQNSSLWVAPDALQRLCTSEDNYLQSEVSVFVGYPGTMLKTKLNREATSVDGVVMGVVGARLGLRVEETDRVTMNSRPAFAGLEFESTSIVLLTQKLKPVPLAMATRSLYRTATAKRIIATFPRTARCYSASKGPSDQASSTSASEPETHFGFQTVKESLKSSKGD